MDAMTSVLSFDDVCFSYGEAEVLHNVSFSVEPGALMAMVGPNGGGKSTLLRLALGLLTPQRGRVLLFGETPGRVCRRVGYVPQFLKYDPAFPVTALDVVLMGRTGMRRVGVFRKADRAASRAALAEVGLADLAGRRLGDLSGGERQRVLVAQALVTDPALLLLDEPTASVDPVVEHGLYDLLHALTARMPVVVVSHNLSVVTRHATHVACVNRTVSVMPLSDLTQDDLHAVYRGGMAVLQHDQACHVIDPSAALRMPHTQRLPGEEA